MLKKSHHFLTLWPWPLTYDLGKLIRSGHYHYQCVYQIWEQSIPWFLRYCVNTIAGGRRLRRKTITSPDPSDRGDIIKPTSFTRNKIFWSLTQSHYYRISMGCHHGHRPCPVLPSYSDLSSHRGHRGEAMCISLIDFSWYCTKRNGFK